MMIKTEIEKLVNNILIDQKDQFNDQDIFYVNSKVSADNRISVFIDSMNDVHIKDCVKLSRLIEEELDRDKEDFELIVSSAGLDQAFLVKQQYEKNIGKQIQVKSSEGNNYKGELISMDDEGIILKMSRKRSKNKKNEIQETEAEIKFNDIKEAKVVITF